MNTPLLAAFRRKTYNKKNLPATGSGVPVIRAVVFDLDGTLLKQAIDFPALRRELGAPDALDIIRYVDALSPAGREKAMRILEKHERKASENSELNEGAREALEAVRSAGLRTAVLTRNSRHSVEAAIRAHGMEFDRSVCRGDAPAKPSPAPVLQLAESFGVSPSDVLMVGDYAYDTESAIRAGAVSVYLTNGNPPRIETRAHFVIRSLVDLLPLIEGLNRGLVVPGAPRTVEA
jgi:HAD superfamily hydrolase (TIGR01509 family)